MIKKSIISILFSALMLFLLFKLISTGAEQKGDLLTLLKNVSWPLILLFLISTLVQAAFRALRYQVLLQAGLSVPSQKVPPLFHVFLVTLSRNMFVDMVPARMGELSYVAMLNRGCAVGGDVVLSSLSISLLFDYVALLFIFLGLAIMQITTTQLQGWLLAAFITLAVLVAAGGLILFWGIGRGKNFLEKCSQKTHFPVFKKIASLVDSTAQAIQKTRNAKVLTKTLLLSLAIRFFKYAGFYAAFLAVTVHNFPELASTSAWNAITSFLGAEAAASLPIPAFMSFGTYETGGLITLKLLGFSTADSTLTMLAIHIYSQIFDYTLGSLGFILFLFRTGGKKPETTI